MNNFTKGEQDAMREEESTSTQEVSVSGAIKNEWLDGWGYELGTEKAEQAWKDKLAHDIRVDNIPNPNRVHGRLYELPSYQSPITGQWIDGRVARREDLARSGCVEYDESMKTEQTKRHAQEDAALDKKVDEIVEKTIYEMPAAKREQLATELEHSDVEVTRV
jgi:hypothetical protein